MRIHSALKMIALSLALLLIAGGCGIVESAQDRVSERFDESTTGDRLAERSEETLARIDGARPSEMDVLLSDTVTLQQLQDAGIPVGSYQIDCDQPLHMVVVEGVFDRDNLFATGASLAGGTAEGLAMRLVAQIYDPDTDMPLGMIGDQDGGRLNSIAQGSSISDGTNNGALLLESEETGDVGNLVPEAVCQ